MTDKRQAKNVSFQLVINPEDERTFGPCSCCGNMTRRVWGYVTQDESTIAAYFVEWTPGHVEKAANFDLIVGKWGEDADPVSRKAVALDFRQLETGPAFRVINAKDRPVGTNPLVGEALSREQIIGEPIAQTIFGICDTVFLEDHGYDLAGLADRGNRSLQVDGVPEHDGGDHQIQTTGAMALVSMPTKASRKR